MNLRRAKAGDIEAVMRILDQARLAQLQAGFRQWEKGYPPVEKIEADIESAAGYILDADGRSAGYIAIAKGDEEYDRHPELWDVGSSYCVFHRIAISDEFRGKGMSDKMFDLAESHALSIGVTGIRIDTGVENRPMQHILQKRGYILRGECDFIWGKRLAYEKTLF